MATSGATYYTIKGHISRPEQPPSPPPLSVSLHPPPPFDWETVPGFLKRKYTAPYPEHGSLWNMASLAVMGGVGLIAKGFLSTLTTTHVYGMESFLAILHQEDRTRGVITVSNHASVWDDPFLWGALPTSTLFSPKHMRWVMCAADICYTNVFKATFFSLGQGIPTVRGAGVYQPAVDFSVHKLNQSGWIHIFPEARVCQEDAMIRFKWGIGRIIMEAKECPIVVPIWHQGNGLYVYKVDGSNSTIFSV
ncbi:acyltransferase-domain-containing protein [Spinellus fusiger]|nr:acyltransferase-domain-containing protein [Spinellus fusiger]